MKYRTSPLAILMALVLVFSLFGIPAYAAEDATHKDNTSSNVDAGDSDKAQGQDELIPKTNEEENSAVGGEEDNLSSPELTSDVEPEKKLTENSWRYSNGELIVHEDQPKYLRSGGPAWYWTPDGYISSDGSVIPGATLKGIDVSEHQGDINWDAVKNSDVKFAIIRCGYGNDFASQDDKTWQRNVSECERLGIPYGVYLYSYATNTEMADSEASHLLRLLGSHTPSYPVYYDLEENSMADSSNQGLLAQIAQTFCGKVATAGHGVGIYANLNWWNNYLTDPIFQSWTRWVAQYNYKCDYSGDSLIWQSTSSGVVNGINGNVDLNFVVDKTGEAARKVYEGVYDYEYYITNNSDVRAIIGEDERAVFRHFLYCGMNEGRRASDAFDPAYYKRTYADLSAAFGSDMASYYRHFLNAGMTEGRQGSDSFSVQSYYNQYPDLRRAFGKDLKSYYLHYIENGKAEGRSGTGCDVLVPDDTSAIMGVSQANVSKMVMYYNSKNKVYPGNIYDSKGAPNIEAFSRLVYDEASSEGVRAEVLFCQAMKETGWLQFGGSVRAEQCNFGGLGANFSDRRRSNV